jgi:hypothetical protein
MMNHLNHKFAALNAILAQTRLMIALTGGGMTAEQGRDQRVEHLPCDWGRQ